MTKVAYYKGCLASLSAKELDTSTQALAPMLDLELDELESVTCCGAGDIHEAEPDYYLHLNARILAYAAATGAETLMTICNVCTLNLRQANFQLVNDPELRARVNTNLATVGVPPYEDDIDVKHLLWLIVEDDGAERLRQVAHKGLKGLKIAPFYGCQILRPSKLKATTGRDFKMPILHLSQLVGVAAGLEESELKFKRHVVPVDPVLEKLEI